MKVAIPVEDKSLQVNICVSFGRTPYFVIYDTDTQTVIYLNNTGIASQGGAGIKAAQAVVDSGAQAVIAARLGENASSVLSSAGIKAYQSVFGSAQKNLEAFQNGSLSLLTDIHPGFHNHGGQ